MSLRPDLEIISRWIRPGTRLLDLGCGDGALLRHLQETRDVTGYGLEIDDVWLVTDPDSEPAIALYESVAGRLFRAVGFEWEAGK